ncbi:phage tail tape measure protein [Lachnospiraceae bacterium MD329]|nr:phage tail tape measure protein [Lachnospiraceae bacterium MD329]
MAKKNIGATLFLKAGNFFSGIKSASSASDGLKSKLSGATSSLSSFSSSGKKTSGTMSAIVKGIAGITAACISLNAAVGFGKSVIELGSAYQDSVAKVSTIADTTVKSISELSSETLALSNATGTAATDINEALYQAISAGADTAHATELVGVAVKAAKGGFTDTTTAVDGLTSVLNTYGMATTDAQSLANQFLITQNKGKTSFGELATTIGQVAPVAKSTGVGIDELLSGVASLTANGLSTSSAMTGMKAALSNIIKPTSDAQKMAKELGIDFSTTALQSQGLSGFMKTLAEKTGGNTDKMAKLFGSVEGLNAMLTLTSSGGMKLMGDTMSEMQNNTTALEDAYGAMTNTVTAQVDVLKNKLSNMKINIFEQLDGSRFVELIKKASDSIDKFTPAIADAAVNIGEFLFSAVEKLYGILKVAGKAVLGVIRNWDLLLPAILPIVTVIGLYKAAVLACNVVDGVRNGLITAATVLTGSQAAAFAPLTTMTIAQTVATSALSAAQTFLNAAFIASPIGWIVLGIGTVVAVFVVLWKKCEGFRNFWKGLWSGIKTAVSVAWVFIKPIFEGIKTVVGGVKSHLSGVFGGIKQGVGIALNAAKETVQEKLSNIKNAYDEHGGGIKGAAFAAIEGVKGYYTAGFTFMDKITGGKLTAIVDKLKEKFTALKESVANIFNGIKDKIANIWDGIKDLIKTPHIEQEGTISIAGINTKIPKLGIKWYANGGIMTRPTAFGISGNTAHVGGEAGAEAILPLKLFWDNLDRALNKGSKNAGGNSVNVALNVEINADNRSADEIADDVIKVLVPKLKLCLENL